MLNPSQMAAREGKLTASRVACLMNGDSEKIMSLWQELVGDPAFVPEDLTSVWPVRLGEATEALNLEWFSRQHGAISRLGEVVTHANGWAAATIDAWSDAHQCPVEAKHVGGREPLEVIIDRYQPQMHWQMIVTGTTQCALSVIMGASAPIVEFIPRDERYSGELWSRAATFWRCVEALMPPVALAPASVPVKAERIYQMQGHNAWASDAAIWLEHKDAAKKAITAEKSLKDLVPADAKKCIGHGVQITRNRAGSLSLREAS